MWDTLVLAQRQICIKRNNRHIDMVTKLSFRPKEKEVRVSTFSSTRLVSNEKQLCLLCHWCLVVALATKMSYNSQNYYHDCPFHYLATLSQFHNCLSVLF